MTIVFHRNGAMKLKMVLLDFFSLNAEVIKKVLIFYQKATVQGSVKLKSKFIILEIQRTDIWYFKDEQKDNSDKKFILRSF